MQGYKDICCIVGDIVLRQGGKEKELIEHIATLGDEITALKQELNNGPDASPEDN